MTTAVVDVAAQKVGVVDCLWCPGLRLSRRQICRSGGI